MLAEEPLFPLLFTSMTTPASPDPSRKSRGVEVVESLLEFVGAELVDGEDDDWLMASILHWIGQNP